MRTTRGTSKKRIAAWVLLTLLGTGIVLIMGDAAINKFTATHEDDIASVDQRALHEVSVYAASERDDDTAWKNTSVTDHPILLMSKASGYSYLINPTSSASSLFSQHITIADNPGKLSVYRLSRLYPRLWLLKALGGNFNTIGRNTSVLGDNVYYLKFDDDNLDAPYSSEHLAAFLAHESFHYYGQREWSLSSRFIGELNDTDYKLISQKMTILDEVRTALRADQPNQQQLQSLAQQLVDLERERAAVNPDYVPQEQWMETVEGTAQFMGISAAREVGYDYGVMYFDNTKDAPFADVVPFYQAGKLDENFLRDRLPYESGAQIALLAQALDPAGTWQDFLNAQTPEKSRTLIEALEYVLNQ